MLAVAALVALGALWLIPSGHYVLLPDTGKPVDPIVMVPGEEPVPEGTDITDGKGQPGMYYVDVLVRKATLLERLFPGINDGATLLPEEAINPPGVSDSQRREADLQDMARSQDIAAAVALRELGYDVEVEATGILVDAIAAKAPATGKLRPGDLIVAVDGTKVRTTAALTDAMKAKRPGDEVRFTVRRGGSDVELRLGTRASEQDAGRAVVGIVVSQGSTMELPVKVEIDAGDIGGPSAGLPFALDVLDELGREVDRGRVIAATGALRLDGTVEPVGGIRQKTIGAIRAGATIFLVPAGDNAAEARRYAGEMRVVPVESFQQALSALATPASTT